MVTDPARVRRAIQQSDVCPWATCARSSAPKGHGQGQRGCRSAGIGCISAKGRRRCTGSIASAYAAARKPAGQSAPRPDILETGSAAAGKVADATMKDVRASMGMSLEFESKRKP
jgi:hypothetical protein